MGLGSKTVTIASALAGLAVFSQAPEFAQQYRQRIGGAVDELKTVVGDFDRDASASQMTRGEALENMAVSKEQLYRFRGQSITHTIGRFERLNAQQGWLEKSHPFTRPLLVLKSPDSQLINKAWDIFEPAVPLNAPGALYGGLGALFALLLARMGIGGARRLGKRRDDRKLAKNLETPPLLEPSTIEAISDEMPLADDEPYVQSELERAEIIAQRMELALSKRKGIPEVMQVAPVKPDRVPYLKVEKPVSD